MRNGVNYLNVMVRGKVCMPASGNGKGKEFLKWFSEHYPLILTLKIFRLTPLAQRFIKARTGMKKGGKAVGLTRGGLNTKIHAIVDGLGNPVEFLLSPGNDHDSTHAIEILSRVEIEGSNILGDRAFDTDAILYYIGERGAFAVIPSKSNRLTQRDCDWWLYKERHLVECFFQKLKWFRRVATRYDKSDESFLGFVYLAAICILVK